MKLLCSVPFFSTVMLLQYFWLHHFDVGHCWMCLFYGAPGPAMLEIPETLLTQSLYSALVFRFARDIHIFDFWLIVVMIILEVTVHLFVEKIDTVVFCASYVCRFLGFCCIPRAKHAEKVEKHAYITSWKISRLNFIILLCICLFVAWKGSLLWQFVHILYCLFKISVLFSL